MLWWSVGVSQLGWALMAGDSVKHWSVGVANIYSHSTVSKDDLDGGWASTNQLKGLPAKHVS